MIRIPSQLRAAHQGNLPKLLAEVITQQNRINSFVHNKSTTIPVTGKEQDFVLRWAEREIGTSSFITISALDGAKTCAFLNFSIIPIAKNQPVHIAQAYTRQAEYPPLENPVEFLPPREGEAMATSLTYQKQFKGLGTTILAFALTLAAINYDVPYFEIRGDQSADIRLSGQSFYEHNGFVSATKINRALQQLFGQDFIRHETPCIKPKVFYLNGALDQAPDLSPFVAPPISIITR